MLAQNSLENKRADMCEIIIKHELPTECKVIELNDPGNRLQFNNTNFQWEGPASPSPLFGVKKEEMTEGRKASRESKSKPRPHPALAQGLDPPLISFSIR